MAALTPERLLHLWELGETGSSTARALALLCEAQPGLAWEEGAALPLGERERRLLALREALLGPAMEAVLSCPSCGDSLEVTLDTRALRSTPPERDSADLDLVLEGLELRFRLPNSFDLLAAEACGGAEEARRRLAARCVLAARRDGAPIPADGLRDEDLTALSFAMTEADPGAELMLDGRCPACGRVWEAPLDVTAFIWEELEAQAQLLLREVHALARAYGWREADVFALSPRRRRFYLEMAGT